MRRIPVFCLPWSSGLSPSISYEHPKRTPPTNEGEKRMKATARMASVVSATSCARCRLIRSVRRKQRIADTGSTLFNAGRLPSLHGSRRFLSCLVESASSFWILESRFQRFDWGRMGIKK